MPPPRPPAREIAASTIPALIREFKSTHVGDEQELTRRPERAPAGGHDPRKRLYQCGWSGAYKMGADDYVDARAARPGSSALPMPVKRDGKLLGVAASDAAEVSGSK